jgi:hypothetical protein
MHAFDDHPAREVRRGMRRRTPILASFTAVLCATAAAVAAPAQAAAPVPVTGAATQITPVGAELNGTVDPRGAATSAFFQYGLTTKYGHGTGNQDAGLNPGIVPISAAIAGLQSSKTYHFRLVAQNKDGKKFGPDKTFKTLAPTTTPVFNPNPVPYGSPFTVTGNIVGTGAKGAQVSLFSRPFPFSAPFVQLGNTVIADQSGNYVFALTSALSTSQFQVKAGTNPPFASAIQTLIVTSRISLKTPGHVKRGRNATFTGLVAPGQDGAIVDIQKLQTNGQFKHWTRAFLRHRNDGLSGYSTKKRIFKTATFRAIVRSNGGAVSPGTSPNVHTIRVTKH